MLFRSRDKMVLNRTKEYKSLDSTRATRALGLSPAKPKRTTSANKSTFRTSTLVDPLLQFQPKVDIERMLLESSTAGGSAGAASNRPQTRSQNVMLGLGLATGKFPLTLRYIKRKYILLIPTEKKCT